MIIYSLCVHIIAILYYQKDYTNLHPHEKFTGEEGTAFLLAHSVVLGSPPTFKWYTVPPLGDFSHEKSFPHDTQCLGPGPCPHFPQNLKNF